MIITDSETGNGSIVLTKVNSNTSVDHMLVDHGEQRELLEALARNLGFTLIDREERKELLTLTEEVDKDDNQYEDATTAWVTWQNRCEALAAAVNSALRTDDPQEA